MRIKQSLLCVYLLLAVSNLLSQTNRTDFGLESGISRIYLSGTAVDQKLYKARVGFTGGIFVQFNSKKIFSLRTGVTFEKKGSGTIIILTDQNGQPIGEFNFRQNFNYLTVPVLIRASFGKTFRFFVNAGPYAAYLVSQPNLYMNYYSVGSIQFKKLDYGISGGLGCLLPLGKKAALGFEIRHSMGLCDIAPVSRYGTNGTIKTNSTNLILSFTRKLGLRK